MPTKLLTNDYKLHVARQLQESIDEEANTAYYFFFSNHFPREDLEVPAVDNNQRTTLIDVYREMIMGKRVTSQDIAVLIRNNPYTANTIYEMYDDKTNNIFSTNFFVSVDEGSFKHVYKCLDNNQRARSLFEPQFSHIVGSNTVIYQTADGYRWKYMYSISESAVAKFGSFDFIPVVANNDVKDQAVFGSIDIIKVEDQGRGYDNHINGTFSPTDLRIDGNPNLYAISNTAAPAVNGFFTGCILYLSSGTGAGAYRRINDYFVASNGTLRIISLESPFTGLEIPAGDTDFQITPEVRIIGDGSQTINAVARALVNATSSNSIYRIEMLERGRDYDFALASVVANSVVQIDKPALVRPIYPPTGGHGFDAESELGASRLCVSVNFANNESNTILIDNQIQQVGILQDPLFQNVRLNVTNPDGVFELEEKLFKITPTRINTNATLETTNNTIICNTAEFDTQVKINDYLYLKSSNGTSHQLTRVSGVVNNTEITIQSNGLFSCTETLVYLANVSSHGVIKEAGSTFVLCSNVKGIIVNNDEIIGELSGAHALVDNVVRSSVTKSFNTFVQLYKYTATVTSGTFEENETVFRGPNANNQQANAIVHSVINIGGNDRIIYTSNQVGVFTMGSSITGLNSGATAQINSVNNPELVFASGKVLYIENVESFTRAIDQTETFKLILEF
jgi:hypothetical protein